MSYEKFYKMLDKVPRLSLLWDRDKNKLNADLFESELAVMSSQEVAMAKFFASLWFHNNSKYGFDVADEISSLDQEFRNLIANWCAKPFWP